MPKLLSRRLLVWAAWPILAFAALAHAAPPSQTPEVRVLVLDKARTLKLSVKGQYEVFALPGPRPLGTGKALNGRIVSAEAGRIRFGSELLPVRALRIHAESERDIQINTSTFRGWVEIRLTEGSDALQVINTLDIESYLYGVLHNEVAHWWPMEALKAQAIAARTYALYQVQVSRAQPFDVRSSVSSQVYSGATNERFRAKRAVDMTRGLVLTHQGRLFPAYFHATCSGMTAAASELWKIDTPPLAGGVRCEYCKISPHYFWNAKVPLSDVEQKLAKSGRPVGRILSIEQITRTPSGRVGSLRIVGDAGQTVVAAKDLRVWVGGDKMRSTDFTVSVRDDTAHFKGEGWGHGVGLCQWGALGQSLLGRNAETILAMYYPGSTITRYDA